MWGENCRPTQETQTEPAAPDSQQVGNEAFEPTTQLAYDDHLARQADEERPSGTWQSVRSV